MSLSRREAAAEHDQFAQKGDGDGMNNSDISINTGSYTVNSSGELSTTSSGSTYKWVLFGSSDDYSILKFTVQYDSWIVLRGNATNAVAVAVNSTLAAGTTRNFTTSEKIDLLEGDTSLTKASVGDSIHVERSGDIFNLYIKRSGAIDYVAWFTINLTGLVADSTIRPKYGLLNVSAATGMVASEMYNYSSNDTPPRGELETLKADYEQFKFSSSTAPPNEVDLVMFMGQSIYGGLGHSFTSANSTYYSRV